MNSQMIAATRAQAKQATTEAEGLRRSLADAHTTIALYASKWQELNAFLNEAADDANLCSEYEDALDEWNRGGATRFQLCGRQVTESHTVTLTITSTRPQHAEDLATGERYYLSAITEAITDYLNNEGHEAIEVI